MAPEKLKGLPAKHELVKDPVSSSMFDSLQKIEEKLKQV